MMSAVVTVVILLTLVGVSSFETSASPTPNSPVVMLYGGILEFAGTGVIFERHPQSFYRLLSVWHVANLPALWLRTRAVDCCPYRPELVDTQVQCRAPITIVRVPDTFHDKGVEFRTVSLSFRLPKVGEWLTLMGYPDGSWVVLRVKVQGYRRIVYAGEDLNYMLLAPADFEYWPETLQGLSGGPLYDRFGKVVGLISLEVRTPLKRKDVVAAVPLAEGLGRCKTRISR